MIAASTAALTPVQLRAAPMPAGNDTTDFSVLRYGAKGDGSDATSAIQAAIDAAAAVRGRVFLPAGRYVLSRSLRIPSFITLEGEGPGSILDNQNVLLNEPQCVNQDGALIFFTARNLVFCGGTHAFKVEVKTEVAGLRFEGCAFELQADKCLEFNKLLQTSIFTNCSFDRARYGLYVAAFTSNANNFINCHFTNMAFAHVHMVSAEVNLFSGCRFEGGGVRGRHTIELEDARAVSFIGCYFESTHEYLLKETRSAGSTRFESCHFTGALIDGKLGPYRFDSDGAVLFGPNSWGQPSVAPAKAMITGTNRGMIVDDAQILISDAPNHRKLISPPTNLDAAQPLTLLAFEAQSDGAPSARGLRSLSGTLTLNVALVGSQGGATAGSVLYHFMAIDDSEAAITLSIAPISDLAGRSRQTDALDTFELTVEIAQNRSHIAIRRRPRVQGALTVQWMVEYSGFALDGAPMLAAVDA